MGKMLGAIYFLLSSTAAFARGGGHSGGHSATQVFIAVLLVTMYQALTQVQAAQLIPITQKKLRE